MKIAIIDDDKYWRDCAEKTIRKYFGKARIHIDIFENGEEYIKRKRCYDVSFIDIEMPNMDGFETITKARQFNRDGIYIILTTHVELSRKGYVVNAFRYIHKTGLEEEIFEALKSAEILLGRNVKIKVNAINEGQRELVLKNIIYIETERPHILVHTTHEVIKCNNTMAEMENELSGKWFYRCHNAYIVNLDEVRSIKNEILYMSNGDKVDVAQRKYWKFKKLYLQRQYECANG